MVGGSVGEHLTWLNELARSAHRGDPNDTSAFQRCVRLPVYSVAISATELQSWPILLGYYLTNSVGPSVTKETCAKTIRDIGAST